MKPLGSGRGKCGGTDNKMSVRLWLLLILPDIFGNSGARLCVKTSLLDLKDSNADRYSGSFFRAFVMASDKSNE